MVRLVLAREVREAGDDARRDQFNGNLVGKARTFAVPFGMPVGVWIAIHGVLRTTVLTAGFLTIRVYDAELNFDDSSSEGNSCREFQRKAESDHPEPQPKKRPRRIWVQSTRFLP